MVTQGGAGSRGWLQRHPEACVAVTPDRFATCGVVAGSRGEPGTLQVLPAESLRAISEVLINDPRIRKLTFTGSTEVGRSFTSGGRDDEAHLAGARRSRAAHRV